MAKLEKMKELGLQVNDNSNKQIRKIPQGSRSNGNWI